MPPLPTRTLGRTGRPVSIVGLGCPQLGADGGEVAALTPAAATTARLALRWAVGQPGVTTVIPGARSAEQARGDAAAADLPPLGPDLLAALEQVDDRSVREHVHDRW